MQLYTLSPWDNFSPGDFRLFKLIEGYSSLIWTERYRNPGDFQLKTPIIADTRTDLAIGNLVSLIDTTAVFMVETHEINVNDAGEDELTVTGRSYETYLENRPNIIDDNGVTANDQLTTPWGDIPTDYTMPEIVQGILQIAALDPLFVGLGGLDNHSMTISLNGYTPLAPQGRAYPREDAYSSVIKMLAEEDMGIRTRRPLSDLDYTIDINIYKGQDVSGDVVLDVSAGHFIGNVKYYFSYKDYFTTVWVSGRDVTIEVSRSGASGYQRMQRRTGLLDIQEITGTGTTVEKKLAARGRSFLGDHGKTTYFEGQVSPNIPYVFKTHYNLGDIIWARGQYGISQEMQVTEYVRTEDLEVGEAEYPTVSAFKE